jgi:hypothetical protein
MDQRQNHQTCGPHADSLDEDDQVTDNGAGKFEELVCDDARFYQSTVLPIARSTKPGDGVPSVDLLGVVLGGLARPFADLA